MRPILSSLVIALTVSGAASGVTFDRAQDGPSLDASGAWTNGRHVVTLAVTGTAATGAFSCAEGRRSLTGSVSGTWDQTKGVLLATWSWQTEAGPRQFKTSLVMARHGITLDGLQWGAPDQEGLSAFSLRRIPATGGAPPLDQDVPIDVPNPPEVGGIPAPPAPEPAASPESQPPPAATSAPPPPGEGAWLPPPNRKPVRLLDLGNTGAVRNGPRVATTFTIDRPHFIVLVRTYHWNAGIGAPPGRIALDAATGRRYGPWPARSPEGRTGVAATFWDARPDVVLPAGTYTVVTSSPATWSHNPASGNRGFTWIDAHPVPEAAGVPGAGTSSGEGVDGHPVLPEERRQTFFFEGFDDNRRKWTTGLVSDGTFLLVVEGGRYTLESRDANAKASWRSDVAIDAARDFEIEARLTFVRGTDDQGQGILWGGRDRQNEYRFLFSANGYFKVQKVEAGRAIDMVGWTKTGAVGRSDPVTLTVRKVGGAYRLFINRVLVHTMPFAPFFGPQIGFRCAQGSTIAIDDLSVSYLD